MQVEQLNSAQGLTIDGPLLITPRAFGRDRRYPITNRFRS